MSNTAILLILLQRLVVIAGLIFSLLAGAYFLLPGLISLGFGGVIRRCSDLKPSGLSAFQSGLLSFSIGILDTITAFLLVFVLLSDAYIFFAVFLMILIGHIVLPRNDYKRRRKASEENARTR
jgi:hypothetical protein